MAITAAGMKDRYVGKITAHTAQTTDPAEASAASDAILLALFEAVVEEIKANSELVAESTDSDGAIVTGKVQ